MPPNVGSQIGLQDGALLRFNIVVHSLSVDDSGAFGEDDVAF